jgi:hypothetical protein
MKMRIAILATCAGTLAVAQADVARANYDAASESKSPVRITDVGPEPAVRMAGTIRCLYGCLFPNFKAKDGKQPIGRGDRTHIRAIPEGGGTGLQPGTNLPGSRVRSPLTQNR